MLVCLLVSEGGGRERESEREGRREYIRAAGETSPAVFHTRPGANPPSLVLPPEGLTVPLSSASVCLPGGCCGGVLWLAAAVGFCGWSPLNACSFAT